jgi:hypothetical protein
MIHIFYVFQFILKIIFIYRISNWTTDFNVKFTKFMGAFYK